MADMTIGKIEQLTPPTYEDWLFEYRKRLKAISRGKGGYVALNFEAASNLAELSVENTSLRSRVTELEGLLREAQIHVEWSVQYDVAHCESSTCEECKDEEDLLCRIRAALEQKEGK